MGLRGRRSNGHVADWRDERGFGFILDGEHGDRVFLHAKDVVAGHPRPVAGDTVEYDRAPGRDGRLAAKQVRITSPFNPEPARHDRSNPRVGPGMIVRVGAALLLLIGVAVALLLARQPDWLLAAYLVMGSLSFGLYWYDKRQAVQGGWRTAESSLHLIDAAFGIAGGLVAQAAMRHKTRKPAFQVVTTLILIGHAIYVASAIAGSPLFLL